MIEISKDRVERGLRLQSFFESTGMKKGKFAEAMGIHPAGLLRYFSGEYDPLTHLPELVAMGCDPMWLAIGESQREARENRVAEAIAFYDVAKEKGIESAAELKETLERGELAERTLAPEVLATLAAARKSSQAKYQKMRKSK